VTTADNAAQESTNGVNGMSDIEGKAARQRRASAGNERVSSKKEKG
jgi:hypothetical protein